MPEGKTIQFQQGEYAQLDGLPNGSKVKFSGDATIRNGNDGSSELVIDSMDFQTEGAATRELKSMTKQDTSSTPDTGPNDF